MGIQDPRNRQGLVAIVSVKDAAVVTSGDYQRYFEEAGVRYHHILNPATGKPAREVMQTTVLGASATDADILSTILFVLGPKQGIDFLQEVQDTQAIFITPDKQITMTNQLTKQLEFTGEDGYRITIHKK
nr:FAD:protein FMN transferase [Desulforamulus aquiferis]